MSFDSLGLRPELLRALGDCGYTTPTPVQARAIPEILAGRDMLAGAQTGTGKTAGFTLPLLQRLADAPPASGPRAPRALVLVPTRELAAQVADSVRTYGRHLPLRATVVFGGVGFNPQADELRRGTDILVATPGRLLDHAGQRTVDLSAVSVLVLDEADRMLDMGFIHDIKRVLRLLPAKRQNLLFSATYSDEIRQLAGSLLHDPVHVEVARRNAAVEAVSQHVLEVPQADKRRVLSSIIRSGDWEQVLVFTRTKHGANRLTRQLEEDGIKAAAIHGNKSQAARTRALDDFRAGRITVMVATEVAARGLDIEQLPCVVNFELPNVPEDYVHRIGRTGRAGATGTALSLVAPEERTQLRDIERLLGRQVRRAALPPIVPPPPRPAGQSAEARPAAPPPPRNGHRPSGSGRPGRRRGGAGRQHSGQSFGQQPRG
ncbi:MAG: DEAD/DEAH box helicase [Chromatiales bacterium]|jgi:ATP-dependent RNA helicase RhlE|nr:DEAD/DEAH box helicase [Chromatiales bacterium]